LRVYRRTARKVAAIGVPPGRRGRARAFDRRQSHRCDPALRRPAQAAQPARRRRESAAASGSDSVTFLWPELLWLLLAIPALIGAAQAAARAFVADQPASARIGVVSFAATASVVQPPTRNRDDILAAIDRFQLQRGTAVGSGILVSLKTIFPDVEFDLRGSNPR